jgi:hypothetical protein
MPDERFRAVRFAREFLYDLLDPKKTPRVPKEIRQRALSALRHYPAESDMELAAEGHKDIFWTQKQFCENFPNITKTEAPSANE